MHRFLAWLADDAPECRQIFLGPRQNRAAAVLAESMPDDVEPIQLSALGAFGANLLAPSAPNLD